MILVTGASGCLGANLTRGLLAAGHQVAALRLAADPALALADVAGQIDWRVGDLLDPASLELALRGVTHVYHAAGLALPYEHDRQRLMEVNVTGTDNLLAASLRAGVRKLVYVSSIAAIGYPDGVADETMVYNGESIRFSYMHSKYAAENIVQTYFARGLDVVLVCPAAVIAPYCDRLHGWGRIFLDVEAGEMPFIPPGGIAVLSRADLVTGMQAAMDKGRSGERYILASQNVTYRALLASIAAGAGVAGPSLTAPSWLLRSLAMLLGAVAPAVERVIRRPRLSASTLDLMWRTKHYAITKAERELGYVSRQSLDDSVRETWEWLRSIHAA